MINTTSPLVSVIIPTHNRSTNLVRSIESVLRQTYNNFEIIVVDDNSPGSQFRAEAERLMERYKNHDSINYIKHLKNRNGAAARNTGIKFSKGDFIAFLDDDDEWLPLKLEFQVDYLLKKSTHDVCYCLSLKYKNGKDYYKTIYDKEGDLTLDVLSLESEVYTPSLIFKKELLQHINGFDESFLRHQDFELLIKLFRSYKIGCVKEHLVIVHVDDNCHQLDFSDFKSNKIFFLNLFKNSINEFSENDQNKIYHSHDLELFYRALQSKQLKFSFLYFLKSLKRPRYLWFKRDKIFSVLKKIIH